MTDEATAMTTPPAQVGPLSAMVQEFLDEPGMSTRILASRTADPDTGKELLNKDFWSRLARGLIPKAPVAVELEAMAKALRRSPTAVKEAAAIQWLGYEPVHLSGYDDDTRRIIVQTTAMDPSRRRELRVMLEAAAEDKSTN